MQTSVLLSVKPRFARAILNGSKTFEFRKAVFRKPGIQKIVLYASTPVQKVVGEFVLDEVLTMSPADLWAATSDGSGIDRRYFDQYFAGKAEAHALKVKRPRTYPTPLDLREHFGIDRPPQSFCYLHEVANA